VNETNSNINSKANAIKIYVTIGVVIVLLAMLFMTKKKLAYTVIEGLQKIEIKEAMEICAGTRGADSRIVAPSDALDLEIALQNLSEADGLPIEADGPYNIKYYHIIGWNDGSRNGPTMDRELQVACSYLLNNDKNFSKEFNLAWSKKLNLGLEATEADRLKYEPQLGAWDQKLTNLGAGGLRDFLMANSATYNLIRQGAAYSLTGAPRGEVQSVDCSPTNRSRWSNGVPTGWWSCLIDFEGSDYELYSIEFTENSWRGIPDRGRQAGTDLKNIDIPQDLIDWLKKS
jgi:hypothetical protein